MDRFDGFHDACLREASLVTDTFIDVDGGFHDDGRLDTSMVLVFQSQSAPDRAIEVRCTGVTHFRLQPTPENCDSILAGASFDRTPDGYRLGAYFIGLPLTGPPNSLAHRRVDAEEPPALDVSASAMAWRALPGALGPVVRHRGVDA